MNRGVHVYKELEVAIKALAEIEEGFRFSVHGNMTCYLIANSALEEIEKIRNKRAEDFNQDTK